MLTNVEAEPMKSLASSLRTTGTIVALAVAVAACTDANRGYYRSQAEGECLGRGLEAGSKEFALCAQTVESAEYRRWSRGAPGG
jgi:hypothetical protein